MLPVGQPEDVGQLLLDGGDAAGILAANDPGDGLGQVGVELLHPLAPPDDVHGNVGVDVAQHIIVEVDDLVDLQNVLLAVLAAGGVLDHRHLALQLVQAQVPVQVHAPPGGDVVDDDAIDDGSNDHLTPPPTVSGSAPYE